MVTPSDILETIEFIYCKVTKKIVDCCNLGYSTIEHMPLKTHKYTKGDITVIWQPVKCIHSAMCFKGLPGVFDPGRKPWIEMKNGDKEEIITQVLKCPSGALSFTINEVN